MDLIVYTLFPGIMLLFFSGLITTCIHLAFRPDGQVEVVAVKAGRLILAMFAFWMILIAVIQEQAPVLTFGQLSVYLAFLIWLGYNYVQYRIRQRLLSLLPMITVVLLILIGMGLGVHPGVNPPLVKGAWVVFHITLSLAGVALLLGSGVFAAGTLVLHRQIERHAFGTIFSKLPPLEDMHRLRQVSLYMGWILITASLGSAYIWAQYIKREPKMVISHLHPMLTLWAVVTVLVLAQRFHWLGRHRSAIVSVILASLVLILIIVSIIEIFVGAWL